jgi:hypothetical protein
MRYALNHLMQLTPSFVVRPEHAAEMFTADSASKGVIDTRRAPAIDLATAHPRGSHQHGAVDLPYVPTLFWKRKSTASHSQKVL